MRQDHSTLSNLSIVMSESLCNLRHVIDLSHETTMTSKAKTDGNVKVLKGQDGTLYTKPTTYMRADLFRPKRRTKFLIISSVFVGRYSDSRKKKLTEKIDKPPIRRSGRLCQPQRRRSEASHTKNPPRACRQRRSHAKDLRLVSKMRAYNPR